MRVCLRFCTDKLCHLLVALSLPLATLAAYPSCPGDHNGNCYNVYGKMVLSQCVDPTNPNRWVACPGQNIGTRGNRCLKSDPSVLTSCDSTDSWESCFRECTTLGYALSCPHGHDGHCYTNGGFLVNAACLEGANQWNMCPHSNGGSRNNRCSNTSPNTVVSCNAEDHAVTCYRRCYGPPTAAPATRAPQATESVQIELRGTWTKRVTRNDANPRPPVYGKITHVSNHHQSGYIVFPDHRLFYWFVYYDEPLKLYWEQPRPQSVESVWTADAALKTSPGIIGNWTDMTIFAYDLTLTWDPPTRPMGHGTVEEINLNYTRGRLTLPDDRTFLYWTYHDDPTTLYWDNQRGMHSSTWTSPMKTVPGINGVWNAGNGFTANIGQYAYTTSPTTSSPTTATPSVNPTSSAPSVKIIPPTMSPTETLSPSAGPTYGAVQGPGGFDWPEECVANIDRLRYTHTMSLDTDHGTTEVQYHCCGEDDARICTSKMKEPEYNPNAHFPTGAPTTFFSSLMEKFYVPDQNGGKALPTTNQVFALGYLPFTIEMWVKSGATSVQNQFLWANQGSMTMPNFCHVALESGTKPYFGSWNGAVGNERPKVYGPDITVGRWHHIAVVRKGTYVQVFSDGVPGVLSSHREWENDFPAKAPAIGYNPDNRPDHFERGRYNQLRITKGTQIYKFSTIFSPIDISGCVTGSLCYVFL